MFSAIFRAVRKINAAADAVARVFLAILRVLFVVVVGWFTIVALITNPGDVLRCLKFVASVLGMARLDDLIFTAILFVVLPGVPLIVAYRAYEKKLAEDPPKDEINHWARLKLGQSGFEAPFFVGCLAQYSLIAVVFFLILLFSS